MPWIWKKLKHDPYGKVAPHAKLRQIHVIRSVLETPHGLCGMYLGPTEDLRRLGDLFQFAQPTKIKEEKLCPGCAEALAVKALQLDGNWDLTQVIEELAEAGWKKKSFSED